jgi:hypothetical protein
MPQPLYPWERDPIPIEQEAGWVWRGVENLTPTEIQTFQAIASHYTNYDIPTHY